MPTMKYQFLGVDYDVDLDNPDNPISVKARYKVMSPGACTYLEDDIRYIFRDDVEPVRGVGLWLTPKGEVHLWVYDQNVAKELQRKCGWSPDQLVRGWTKVYNEGLQYFEENRYC